MSGKLRAIALICFFLMLTTGILYAQTPRELQFGNSVSGYLQEGEEIWFSVRSFEVGFISVETSGDIDTYLEAYSSSRDFINEDDDSGEGNNAKVEIVGEAGKTYLFKLRGYDEDVSGPFNIRAQFRTIPQPVELRFGTSRPENLRAGEEQWYSVRSSETGFVIVETTGDLDTYLHVYDSSYSHMAEDDDGGENFNARLEIFAEAGKTYHFRLRGYDEEVSGAFRIWASFEPMPPDTERNTDRSRAVSIRLGEPYYGYLRSDSESRWYVFEMTRSGFALNIQTRGSLDTVITLYDNQGNYLAEDDDSGENQNALVSIRPSLGNVYIEVKEYSGLQGRFTLHAELR